jgi:hypothetical protein
MIALARRRTSDGMPSTGTPNISDGHGVNVEAFLKRILSAWMFWRDVGQHPCSSICE